MAEKLKVTEDMTISEIIKRYPDAAQVMIEHGLYCVGCPVASAESLGQGAAAHGIDPRKLVDAINKKVAGK